MSILFLNFLPRELEKHLAENKVKAENETTNQLLVEIIDLLKK